MRIVSIDGEEAVAEVDGVRRSASLMMLDEAVVVGDYVIVHAGFAIARLDPAEAQETLSLMRQVFRLEDMA
jgi:hydrogenase expression/formation protein HypC